MADDERKPLGIYDCPFCGEKYTSLDQVEVGRKRESDIIPGEMVTCVGCTNCGKTFVWEDNERWT